MFDGGVQVGLTISCKPCPAARPHGLDPTMLAWSAGWLDGLEGLDGWMAQRRFNNEWRALSTAVSHLIRQNAGWDWKRVGEDEKPSTAHRLVWPTVL